MRKFVFKLEGLLEQRRHAETCCQRALAEAQRQMMGIEEEIDRVAVTEKSAQVPLRGRIDPRALAVQVRFSQMMREKLSTLRGQLADARIELATAQATLVEAGKQRKVLEKLQEKQQAKFAEEQGRRDAGAADDLAQQMSRESEHHPDERVNGHANESLENGGDSASFPACPP